MRKSPILAPLFSPLLQGVLAATVLRPGREWYLTDLAAHLDVSPSSLQRNLAKLTEAGILHRRQDGNRVYYRVDPDCPILSELTAMLTKTAGIAEPIRQALLPFADQVRVAFIHGSVAEEQERSESDVDVIVVGDVGGVSLATAMVPVRDRLGREINFTRYTAKEFQQKLAAGNHFLSTVLKRKRIFLIGDEDELADIAGRQKSSGRAVK